MGGDLFFLSSVDSRQSVMIVLKLMEMFVFAENRSFHSGFNRRPIHAMLWCC